ncbi:hypothetical protein [Terrarubrum flagellatum]
MAHLCRLAGVVAVALLLSACDKCGNWRFGVFDAAPAADVCGGDKPQG